MSVNTLNPGQTPFIKQLVANDRQTRDQAVDSLRTYLSGKRTFTKLDLLKLWKGLFYCVWMSDRPRTQQRLTVDLAHLVDTMQEETAFLFLECFWETIVREWDGIDVLRMDKFLMLVRQYLASSFRYLKAREWEQGKVGRYMDILKEGPLHARNIKVPNGLRYHLIDIYLDELEKLEPVDSEESADIPIDLLIQPYKQLVEKSPTKVVRTRSRDMLEDERLEKWGYIKANKSEYEEAQEEGEEEWAGFD
ncbi:hypothetical protein BGX38DRAFT_1273177 [Terfezia claveryi]|nr:hypothetical protein BGX38DRAFT_1273177 [Terfezia claveryi]